MSSGLPRLVHDPDACFEPFPLTDTQHAYLLGRTDLFELGNVSTHAYYEFEGALDLPRFITAWERLMARHDVLRLVIDAELGEQRVRPEAPPVPIELIDLRTSGADEAERVREEVRERMSHRVIPLDGRPLFGIVLCRLPGGLHRVHVDFDALILDYLSWKLLLADLSVLYTDPDAELPPLELTFRDYVLAEAGLPETERYRASLEYWTRRLPELPASPRLPLVKDPAEVTRPRFVGRRAAMDAERWERLRVRAAERGLTPTGLALAAFAEVLGTWSESAHFTLNVPRMNRIPLHPQSDAILGEFASFSLLEVDNRPADTFVERAARIQEQGWHDLSHQDVSGVRLLRELARVQGSAQGGRMPTVLTSTIGLRGGEKPLLGGHLRELRTISQTPQVYLDVQIDEHEGELFVNWDAVDELFPPGLMDEMFHAFWSLMERLEADESVWLAPEPVALLDGSTVRPGSTGPDRPVPDELVQHLFETRVAEDPGRPAVIAAGATLTYAELYARANQVAHWLRDRGAAPGRPVAIAMEKGWEQLVGAYGALFAGAPYVPLDTRQPTARLHAILGRTGAGLLLTRSGEAERLDLPGDIRVLRVDAELTEALSTEPLVPAQSPDDLAYVLFTSGSTGEPKGTMIRHRGMVNALRATIEEFGVGPDDRCLAVTALHHDMSTFDIFGVLGAGGTVVIPEADRAQDPAHWAELIGRNGVTLWNSVPAMMEMLLEEAASAARGIGSLRLVLLGGDWIPLYVPGALAESAEGVRVVSVGGPTETTLWNIWHPVDAVDPRRRSIPYGRPIANTRYFILGEGLRGRPDGVTGEMYCAGPGVAAGYWDDPDRTADAFLTHPVTGERLYRTGDLGRFLPDGSIEFVGRADSQVKIRGQRVELGEVEAALGAHPAVASAVAVALGRPDGRGHRGLTAYVTPHPAHPRPDPEEIRASLARLLPEHMVPATLYVLDRFPLTANGKVDRRTLAQSHEDTERREAAGATGSAPRTALERAVALVWERVLGAEDVGAHDDFFARGGDSLLATRIVSRLRDALEVPDLTVRSVLTEATVARLAADLTAREDDPERLEKTAEVYLEIESMTAEEIEAEF